jgi:hypothetical protein
VYEHGFAPCKYCDFYYTNKIKHHLMRKHTLNKKNVLLAHKECCDKIEELQQKFADNVGNTISGEESSNDSLPPTPRRPTPSHNDATSGEESDSASATLSIGNDSVPPTPSHGDATSSTNNTGTGTGTRPSATADEELDEKMVRRWLRVCTGRLSASQTRQQKISS